MAQFGVSFVHIVIAMVVVALLHNCGVMAQGISPTPAMDAGAGEIIKLENAINTRSCSCLKPNQSYKDA
ncbi:unnamed protein product [Dovyalis caffra]|uniref:Uncharacterized protein n=1 Tax=Dovyalis caffra TaxID=77055 RepID=A0AAV1S0R8_9ROSI|nr:unnamed protein product [Dovyalis caffra]